MWNLVCVGSLNPRLFVTSQDRGYHAMAQKMPDAIALLKADHRKVEGLFEQFEKARSDDRRAALAMEICTELTVHAMIEEEIFYPACKGSVEDDIMDEA